jgi:hypothetical protein
MADNQAKGVVVAQHKGNKTGGDRSKLAKALERKGKKLSDRERNMRVRGKSEEHSRVSKKRDSSWR